MVRGLGDIEDWGFCAQAAERHALGTGERTHMHSGRSVAGFDAKNVSGSQILADVQVASIAESSRGLVEDDQAFGIVDGERRGQAADSVASPAVDVGGVRVVGAVALSCRS